MNSNFKISPEDELLLLLCSHIKLDDQTKLKIRSILKFELDWNYLIYAASYHKLKPLFYSQINYFSVNIPINFMTHLKDYYLYNAHKNLLMYGELLKLLEILISENIAVVPYKGPIMAKFFYGDLTLRDFNDIDIIINEKDIPKIKELLISKGYDCLYNDVPLELYRKFEREYTFINNTNHIKIEIKWNFLWKYFNFPKEIADPFKMDKFEVINIEGLDVLALSSENMFLFLCMHSSEHLWIRLSFLCDLNIFIESNNLNWSFIFKRASKLGIKRIVFINMLLLHWLFGFEIPFIFIDCLKFDKSALNIAKIIFNQLFSGKDLILIQKLFVRIRIRENLVLGLKDLIFELIIPSKKNIDRIKLPFFAYPFYYILQPFQFICNLFQNK